MESYFNKRLRDFPSRRGGGRASDFFSDNFRDMDMSRSSMFTPSRRSEDRVTRVSDDPFRGRVSESRMSSMFDNPFGTRTHEDRMSRMSLNPSGRSSMEDRISRLSSDHGGNMKTLEDHYSERSEGPSGSTSLLEDRFSRAEREKNANRTEDCYSKLSEENTDTGKKSEEVFSSDFKEEDAGGEKCVKKFRQKRVIEHRSHSQDNLLDQDNRPMSREPEPKQYTRSSSSSANESVRNCLSSRARQNRRESPIERIIDLKLRGFPSSRLSRQAEVEENDEDPNKLLRCRLSDYHDFRDKFRNFDQFEAMFERLKGRSRPSRLLLLDRLKARSLDDDEDGFLRHNLRSSRPATAAHRTRSYEPPPSSTDTYEPGHSDYGTGDTGYFSQISNGSKISDSSRCPRHAPASTSGSRSPRYSRDMEDVLGDEDDDMETSSQSTLERIQKKAEKYEKNYDSPVKRRLRQKEKKESDKTNRSSLRWSQVFRDLDGALSDLDSLIDIGSQLENRLRDSDDSDVEETPVSSLERTYKDFDRELDRLTGRHSPRRLDSESTREYYERLLLASCYDDEEKNDRLVHNSRTDHNSRDYHNPPRDSRDFHDSRDSRDFHDSRDYHSPRDSRDFHDSRDYHSPRDSRDFHHDSRDNRDSHVSRDNPRTSTTDRAHCDCNFTCHHRCRQQVTLDCQDPGRREKWTPERASNSAETSFQENGAGSCIPQPDFDDDDTSSGYQTAHSDFLPRASVAAHDADLRRRHLAASARPPRPNSSDDSFQDDDEDNDSGYQTAKSHLNPAAQQSFSNDELIKRIEVYNQLNQGHTIMWFDDDSSGITFQGFVRVNMNLMRPINMSLAHRPPSIYEVLAHENTEDFLTANCNTHTTSFYLPKDTVKALHISSETTTQEVIVMLLQKFKITDNPRKFALYEHTVFKDNKSHMRKMSDEERPLRLTLTWLGGDWGRKKLVLQENDSGEIVWEAFSLPELENFLKILNREEQEYAEQVKLKYRLLRLQMQQHSKELIPSPAGESGEGEGGDASSSISQTVEQDNRTPVFV